jgi:hypothetical protein
MFILDLYDFGFGIKEIFNGVGTGKGHRIFNSFLVYNQRLNFKSTLFYKSSEV